jgi:hypothetical protein
MKAKLALLLLCLFTLVGQAQILTNCSAWLLPNAANVQFAAYLRWDIASETNIYSDMLYVEFGTNFNSAMDNPNKKLSYTTTTNCAQQVWAEAKGDTTTIRSITCSKMVVFQQDHLNHYIQITRDFVTWSDLLVTDNYIKVATDEPFAFFRIRP